MRSASRGKPAPPSVRCHPSRPSGLKRAREGDRELGKRPQNKAAARDATAVSIVRSGRKFCNFVGHQQLAEWAPVSRMPLGGLKGNPVRYE